MKNIFKHIIIFIYAFIFGGLFVAGTIFASWNIQEFTLDDNFFLSAMLSSLGLMIASITVVIGFLTIYSFAQAGKAIKNKADEEFKLLIKIKESYLKKENKGKKENKAKKAKKEDLTDSDKSITLL